MEATEMHLDEFISTAPDDDGADVVLWDGGSIRELAQHLAFDPNIQLTPGGDRIDTLIAVIAALAPLLATSRRYSRWIHVYRYQEDCMGLGLDAMALAARFEHRRTHEAPRRTSSWVWSEDDGPVLAIHVVRLNGRTARYLWSRDGIVRVSAARRGKLRREYRQDPKGSRRA
jgi:hypothetical protein